MRTGTVKISSIRNIGFRSDASYHLSEGQEVKRMINASPYPLLQIKDVTTEIFIGNRARRIYVTNKEHGIPFLSSSAILQSDFDKVKLASAKYTPQLDQMRLKKGWTLISRSGTIGNCAFSNAQHAQKLASEDVIRTCPNNILRAGLLYAYLGGKYGYSLLTQGTFGAVIQHIEPAYVASLPIPKFPVAFQEEVDNLIQESATLRESAADILNEVSDLLSKSLFCNHSICKKRNFGSASISSIRETIYTRFDAPIYLNENDIEKRSDIIRLRDLNIKVWYPGIFKRAYVKNGYPYIKGSSLFDINPFIRCDHLSKTKTPMLDQLWLKEGQILMTCAGACGDVKLITKEYDDKKAIGSPDIIRIQSFDEQYTSEYLFAYLRLPVVYQYLQSIKYGSVIERFDARLVQNIPIVKADRELCHKVTEMIKEYKKNTYKAFCKEELAIKMVEKEIESWQK